ENAAGSRRPRRKIQQKIRQKIIKKHVKGLGKFVRPFFRNKANIRGLPCCERKGFFACLFDRKEEKP
ncbi:hypothetical protein, partial [Anaerotignum sp.]|uniref:hypothetical protein n=1 Tax=Anaerotignum sp. TaxID=2039241 RepID=UPI0039A192AD